MAVDKRQILQDKPTRIVEQRTIDDRLNKLAEEFMRFSKAKTITAPPSDYLEVVDVTPLPEDENSTTEL